MTKKIVFMMLSMTSLALLTSSCSSFDEALGQTKKAPDEFQVVVRPPLTLPPSFNLRPGDETDIEETAAVSNTDAVSTTDKVLTKNKQTDASVFDALFGTDERLVNIRNIIDEETLGIQIERRVPLDVLFGDTPNIGPSLDATKEAKRIRKALKNGEDVTATPTPAIDPIEGTKLAIE